MRLTSLALADQSQRWWHLSSIQLAGGIISLPVIGIGSQIAISHGVRTAIVSIIIGNLLVLLASYIMISMSYARRLNAVENAKQYIGVIGSKICAVFLLIGTLGWSGWILLSGAQFLKDHFSFSSFSSASFVGGVASFTLLAGIKGLRRLSLFAICPLLGFLIFIASGLGKPSSLPESVSLFNLSAIALASSPLIGSVIDYPTFFRHSKSSTDAIIAIFVIFIVTSFVEILGVFFANFNQYQNYSSWFSLIVILSMISGVCWNIYAASVGWESLFPIFKDRTEYALIGLLVTIFILNLQNEHFFSFVASHADGMVCALEGVLIILYLKYKHREMIHKHAYLYRNSIWIVSGCITLASCLYVPLTSVDCTFVAIGLGMIAALGFSKFIK